jgi:hypothetical protein
VSARQKRMGARGAPLAARCLDAASAAARRVRRSARSGVQRRSRSDQLLLRLRQPNGGWSAAAV